MIAAAPSTGPRFLLRHLREVMAGPGTAEERLAKTMKVIAANMVSEVCSVYLVRGNRLELFATEGLRADAVHKTRMHRDEGLVGLVATQSRPVALSDAQSHPNFSYRPETGEEIYHSLLGVPVVRGGRVAGVLVVQNRTRRSYTEDEIEAMQTIAMVMAEMVDSLLAEAEPAPAPSLPARLSGVVLNGGLALGTVYLHDSQVVVEQHVADDIAVERRRLDAGIEALRQQVDRMLDTAVAEPGGESREILEAYRMFAHDRGWLSRLHGAVATGLTAEAAVERVQVDTRARMADVSDPYLKERLHDLEDLANRLMRVLLAERADDGVPLPPDPVIVARAMGPAELLDYEKAAPRAVVLEEGAPSSHVAIVGRAMGIPVIGRVAGVVDAAEAGDPVIVDGEHGLVFLRPGADALQLFRQSAAVRERQLAHYAALRDEPAVTLDGTPIQLAINAGLLADLAHLEETGAEAVGLYRTELHFMVRATLPMTTAQTEFYRMVLDKVGNRPVMFRTLDVGGDKILPYMRRLEEENPALGWRAIRLSLDRPALLRMQLRALLTAAAGRELNVMFPMIAEVAEFQAARGWLDREVARQKRLGADLPSAINVGAMVEVPSLAWQLDSLLPKVDFLSIGSNDLLQFLFACDRGNPRLGHRYDILSPPALSFLRDLVRRCDAAAVPVSLCGEAAGHPLEAMALIGLGLRRISMSAASVGPVKAMIRSLDLPALRERMEGLYEGDMHSVRGPLREFAQNHGIAI